MSELSNLTASGNSSIIPGITLSPPRLIDWAEAEIEAAQHYLRTVARSAGELPESARAAMYSRAVDNLRGDPFAFGSRAFDAWAMSAAALPFLLFLSLRQCQPQTSRNQAADLLSGPDGGAVAASVWDLWGYQDQKKAPVQSCRFNPKSEPDSWTGGASSSD
jgi:hypothetical protein